MTRGSSISRMLCQGAALALIAAHMCVAAAQDSAEAGLVNQVSGEVSYAAEGGAARGVQAFMKVRQGDRFLVQPGASVRILFFQGSRQETWKGPAAFRVGRLQGEASTGKPEVAMLPSAVPLKLARLPELIQSARLGGVTVRGTVPRPPLTAQEQAELAQARNTYRTLRSEATADDVTPELYLISVLQEMGHYDEMTPLLDELSKHKPLSPEVEELVQWVRSRQ